MRLGDFLTSNDHQELNYVDSVERKSLKNLAVNSMIGLLSLITAQYIYGYQFRIQRGAMTIHEFLAF